LQEERETASTRFGAFTMRRLLPIAAASAVVLSAGAVQAQAPGRVLSWPGKTAPASVAPVGSEPVAQPARPAPLIASTMAPYGPSRGENRYSPRASAPRMARANVPAPILAPPPVHQQPVYQPPAYPAPVYSAPVHQPPVVSAPVYTAPAPSYPAFTPAPAVSSVTDPVIPDRGFEPAAAPAAVTAVVAPAPAAPTPPVQAAAARPDGPRFYSVHREFGETPDRAPHPAVAAGAAADPLPMGFFSSGSSMPAQQDDDTVEERPISREAPAKPKPKPRVGKR